MHKNISITLPHMAHDYSIWTIYVSGAKHGLRILINTETYDQPKVGCSADEDIGLKVCLSLTPIKKNSFTVNPLIQPFIFM